MPGSVPPWSKNTVIATVGGAGTAFEVDCPWRGTIVGLTCVQDTGAADGFTLNLYDSEEKLPANKIFPTKTAAAAATAIEDPTANYWYENRESTIRQPVRKLYGTLDPAGAGDKQFTLVLRIEQPSHS